MDNCIVSNLRESMVNLGISIDIYLCQSLSFVVSSDYRIIHNLWKRVVVSLEYQIRQDLINRDVVNGVLISLHNFKLEILPNSELTNAISTYAHKDIPLVKFLYAQYIFILV